MLEDACVLPYGSKVLPRDHNYSILTLVVRLVDFGSKAGRFSLVEFHLRYPSA